MIDRSNEELGEIVREWIKRYLPSILLAIVLAVGIISLTDRNREKKHNAAHLLNQQLELLQNNISEGKLEEAKKAYQGNGLDKDEGIAGDIAALLIGGVYQEQDDKTKARVAFEKALKSKDNLVAQTAKWQLANFFLDNQDYKQAENYLKELTGSVYANQIPRLRGDIFYMQGNSEEALKNYQLYQQVSPSPLMELVIHNLQAKINYEIEKKNNPNADKDKIIEFDREKVNKAEQAKLRTVEELARKELRDKELRAQIEKEELEKIKKEAENKEKEAENK